MFGTLSRVTALLLSVGILLTGHGLQLTLLPVHAQGLGWTAYAIGISGSIYFLGFVLGCIVIPSIVARVGHIRTFMVMSAIATIALLGAGLWPQLGAWLLFRAATGFALSGLYMVIESWLNEVSPHDQRGRVLAIYSMISLVGMALGQALMGIGSPLELDLFVVGGILLCLAIVPVGLTRVASPLPLPSLRFTPGVLLRASRVAVVCAVFAGLVTGSFWSLAPVVARAFGLDAGAIGALMSVGILGGAVAQVPVGRLSDHTDRRLVIGGIMVAGAIVALLGALFAAESTLLFYVAIFFIGATTMPIYALCIAHASDNANMSLVEVTSGVLIVHSAGSIVGPLIVAALIDRLGAPSFFSYVLVCLMAASIWTFHRVFVVDRTHEHALPSTILPRTTQVIATLSEGGGTGSPAPRTAAAMQAHGVDSSR
jgi:MFS family permease